MAVRQPALVTADEFEAFLRQPKNCNWNYELIDGAIIEKKWRSELRALSLTMLLLHLGNYIWPQHLGVPAIKRPVQLPLDPHNYRFVDASVVLDKNYRVNEYGPCQVMPEVIGEVKASTERYRKLRKKAQYYMAHGTKLVWLLFPGPELVEVFGPIGLVWF